VLRGRRGGFLGGFGNGFLAHRLVEKAAQPSGHIPRRQARLSLK
jgi:hypothetical protein